MKSRDLQVAHAALVRLAMAMPPVRLSCWIEDDRDNMQELVEAMEWREDGSPVDSWILPAMQLMSDEGRRKLREMARNGWCR